MVPLFDDILLLSQSAVIRTLIGRVMLLGVLQRLKIRSAGGPTAIWARDYDGSFGGVHMGPSICKYPPVQRQPGNQKFLSERFVKLIVRKVRFLSRGGLQSAAGIR